MALAEKNTDGLKPKPESIPMSHGSWTLPRKREEHGRPGRAETDPIASHTHPNQKDTRSQAGRPRHTVGRASLLTPTNTRPQARRPRHPVGQASLLTPCTSLCRTSLQIYLSCLFTSVFSVSSVVNFPQKNQTTTPTNQMKKTITLATVVAVTLIGSTLCQAQEVSKKQQAFERLDTDQNGTLTLEEYTAKVKTPERTEAFTARDTDKNGSLTLQEFSTPPAKSAAE